MKYSASGTEQAPGRSYTALRQSGSALGSAYPVSGARWAGFGRALACALAVCGLLLGSPASVRALDPSTELTPGEPLTLNSHRGVWWPLETAQALAEGHTRLRAITHLSSLQAKKITLLEERLELRAKADANYELSIDTLEEALEQLMETAKRLEAAKITAETDKKVAEEKLSRARYIWTAVGAGVVIVLLGGAWGLTSRL